MEGKQSNKASVKSDGSSQSTGPSASSLISAHAKAEAAKACAEFADEAKAELERAAKEAAIEKGG